MQAGQGNEDAASKRATLTGTEEAEVVLEWLHSFARDAQHSSARRGAGQVTAFLTAAVRYASPAWEELQRLTHATTWQHAIARLLAAQQGTLHAGDGAATSGASGGKANKETPRTQEDSSDSDSDSDGDATSDNDSESESSDEGNATPRGDGAIKKVPRTSRYGPSAEEVDAAKGDVEALVALLYAAFDAAMRRRFVAPRMASAASRLAALRMEPGEQPLDLAAKFGAELRRMLPQVTAHRLAGMLVDALAAGDAALAAMMKEYLGTLKGLSVVDKYERVLDGRAPLRRLADATQLLAENKEWVAMEKTSPEFFGGARATATLREPQAVLAALTQRLLRRAQGLHDKRASAGAHGGATAPTTPKKTGDGKTEGRTETAAQSLGRLKQVKVHFDDKAWCEAKCTLHGEGTIVRHVHEKCNIAIAADKVQGGTGKPRHTEGASYVGAPAGAGRWKGDAGRKAGDWDCTREGCWARGEKRNYASKTECRNQACRAPRPSAEEIARQTATPATPPPKVTFMTEEATKLRDLQAKVDKLTALVQEQEKEEDVLAEGYMLAGEQRVHMALVATRGGTAREEAGRVTTQPLPASFEPDTKAAGGEPSGNAESGALQRLRAQLAHVRALARQLMAELNGLEDGDSGEEGRGLQLMTLAGHGACTAHILHEHAGVKYGNTMVMARTAIVDTGSNLWTMTDKMWKRLLDELGEEEARKLEATAREGRSFGVHGEGRGLVLPAMAELAIAVRAPGGELAAVNKLALMIVPEQEGFDMLVPTQWAYAFNAHVRPREAVLRFEMGELGEQQLPVQVVRGGGANAHIVLTHGAGPTPDVAVDVDSSSSRSDSDSDSDVVQMEEPEAQPEEAEPDDAGRGPEADGAEIMERWALNGLSEHELMSKVAALRDLNARLMAEAAKQRTLRETMEQSIVDRHGEAELEALKQHARRLSWEPPSREMRLRAVERDAQEREWNVLAVAWYRMRWAVKVRRARRLGNDLLAHVGPVRGQAQVRQLLVQRQANRQAEQP